MTAEAWSVPSGVVQSFDAVPTWLWPVIQDRSTWSMDPVALDALAIHQAGTLAHGAASSQRVYLHRDELAVRMQSLLLPLGMALQTPVAHLVQQLSQRFAAAWVAPLAPLGLLRVDILHSQACPKFHTDHVDLRLCCTAYGAGTQWLSAAPGPEFSDAHIQQVPTGVLWAMAGRRRGPGLWHRSPPAHPLAPRLFVALDLDGTGSG